MLNIMNLEAQLLAEIQERQEKLEKLQGVSPKLQALEALLGECKATCEEFGMSDLFLGVLGNFTAPVSTQKANATTAPQPENITPTSSVLTDKEAKAIRQDLKTFLKYEGQRLSDTTIKNLLIEKLEELNKQEFLAEVNLDDKNNFLVEAKKLANLLTEATTNNLNIPTEEINAVTEEVKIPDSFPSTVVVNNGVKVLTPTEEIKEEVNKEEGLNPESVLKSALVQNSITGYYGTVEQDGVIANVQDKECACVRYPQETLLTPLVNLKLVSPAIFTPTPTEEVKDIAPQTPQEMDMWTRLEDIYSGDGELISMFTDKDLLNLYNEANNTTLERLSIATLYEASTGEAPLV